MNDLFSFDIDRITFEYSVDVGEEEGVTVYVLELQELYICGVPVTDAEFDLLDSEVAYITIY